VEEIILGGFALGKRPRWNHGALHQDKYLALEEIQQALGLTTEELASFFALLEKADYGDMRFSFCNATVIIEGYGGRLGSHSHGMACVRVETQERGVTSVVEYRFPRGLNNVLQNRRRERTG